MQCWSQAAVTRLSRAADPFPICLTESSRVDAMGWRLNAINRHKDEIARARDAIDRLRTGRLDIGEVLPGGWLESRKGDLIAHYERVIPELEAIVARLEDGTD